MRLIGYIRCSTDEQATHGVSLDAQVDRIKAYTEYMGHELVEIVADRGVSAKDTNRPGLNRVKKLIFEQDKADALVVYRIDRFARNTLDFLTEVERFTKLGKEFISLTEQIDSTTPHGRMIMTVFAAFAQMEREIIGVRTSEALQKRKRDGTVYGYIPYGYRREGKRLIADNYEQQILTYISSMLDDDRSYHRIATNLNRLGYRNRNGNMFKRQNVLNISKSKGIKRRVK